MNAVTEPSARILIVDDTDANRYALRRFVEGAGHTVLEANTGEGGFTIADREHPDLVILDVNLPDIDGFATCRKIKTNPHTADIPVIQVSASFVRAPEQVKGLEGGADAYLTQPVEPMVLLATVKAVLRAHRTERELRQVQMQLRAALEAAGMETFSIDWPTRQIWRYTEPALHNQKMQSYARPLDDFIASVQADDRQPLRERIESSIASQQRYEAEYRVEIRGETRWRLERGHVVTNLSGAAQQLIGVSMDVTERKAMVETLVLADQRKDEFLAMLAHELRNPLAPIRNAARVLDQLTAQDENVKAMLAVIHRQVNQMTRLVDDLLDVSRITRGKVELKLEPMLLSTIIDYAVETTRPLVDSRKHELILDITPQPLWITGDFARLGQALSNIMSNAAKYTEPGGHIEVRMQADGNDAVISVKDDGIGIPPALLPDVFELFMQGDRTLDRSQGGLGIGLALVKSLIDFHHGTVHAHSDGTGRGSEFIIRLPLSNSPSKQPHVADPVAAPIARRRRILIVDDNRDSAESMAALLRIDRHDVHIAHSGPAALQLAATLKPEVVFLDIGLPGMSGLEVVRRLRDMPDTARSKIIALTGYGQPDDYRRSMAAGFDQHLVKPLDPGAVVAILRE
jgi:signal transduction histidine kinase/DNA-binding response OmpR family regulator